LRARPLAQVGPVEGRVEEDQGILRPQRIRPFERLGRLASAAAHDQGHAHLIHEHSVVGAELDRAQDEGERARSVPHPARDPVEPRERRDIFFVLRQHLAELDRGLRQSLLLDQALRTAQAFVRGTRRRPELRFKPSLIPAR
jgi:hypothetical protein